MSEKQSAAQLTNSVKGTPIQEETKEKSMVGEPGDQPIEEEDNAENGKYLLLKLLLIFDFI